MQQRRDGARRPRRGTARGTRVAVVVLGLVATGCLAPFDLDDDGAADIAWVVPADTGAPTGPDQLQLVRHGEVDPVATGAADTTTWLAGNRRGTGRWGLVTIGGDGTWHTESGDVPTGYAGGIPFLAQLDGAGEREAVWYHEATGTYHLEDASTVALGVGDDGAFVADHDIPVPADYDGDGTDDLAVYRPTDGTWWVEGSATPLAFDGGIGLPAPADYDGDGTDEPAIHDVVTGEVRIDGLPAVTGLPPGVPAPADVDGDGAWDPAVATTDHDTGIVTLHVAGHGTFAGPEPGAQPWTLRQATAHRLGDLRQVLGTPLPLAGTTNFLGTGNLGYSTTAGSLYQPEGMALSINGKCTSKAQGDRTAAGWTTSEDCTGTTNPEYDPAGYTYTIDVPPGRTEPVDVLIFDGAYIPNSPSSTRRQDAGLPAPSVFADDFPPGGSTGVSMRTRFRLLAPDATPEDPTDNPSVADLGACATSDPGADGDHTFEPPTGTSSSAFATAVAAETTTTFFPTTTSSGDPTATFRNSSVGWFTLCRIPADAAGTYLLQVDHLDELTRGSNNFAVVARTPGADALCARAAEPTCPTVGALRHLSARAQSGASSTQRVLLAQVDAAATGSILHLELFDPAEGQRNVRFLHGPVGGPYTYLTFDWASSDGNGGRATNRIPVSSYNFNADIVAIEVPVTAAGVFLLEYESSGTVTDRTTYSADLLPAPSLYP